MTWSGSYNFQRIEAKVFAKVQIQDSSNFNRGAVHELKRSGRTAQSAPAIRVGSMACEDRESGRSSQEQQQGAVVVPACHVREAQESAPVPAPVPVPVPVPEPVPVDRSVPVQVNERKRKGAPKKERALCQKISAARRVRCGHSKRSFAR